MRIAVVTSNPHKADEVSAFFEGAIEVNHIMLDIPEYRSDDVSVISREKARYAYKQLQTPLIVDDTGFFIEALKGFPGPYAAYVLQSIGNAGILKLMEGKNDRRAHFITAIAFADGQEINVFLGTVNGSITLSPRGSAGFGYDSIFEVNGKTFAELPLKSKNFISHRAEALSSFRDWYIHEQSNAGDTNG